MKTNMKFGALWIGNQLTRSQSLCLSSFVYYGHEVTLFVYDKNIVVPDGVIKKDANEIIPEEKVFIHLGSYAPFADIFRIHMIKKTGLTWIDVDTLCLSSDWNFPNQFIFGKGFDENDHIITGVLGIPKDHPVLDHIILSFSQMDISSTSWTGYMFVVTKSLKKFRLFNLFQKAEIFSPIDWKEIDVLYKKEKFDYVMSKINNSKCMAIYNSSLNTLGVDQNIFPEGSAMEYFNLKFNVGKK
jgi:hypothetical protein